MTIEKRQADAIGYADAYLTLKEAIDAKSEAERVYDQASKCERTYATLVGNTVGANIQTRIFRVSDSSVVVVQYHNATYTSVTLQKLEPTE